MSQQHFADKSAQTFPGVLAGYGIWKSCAITLPCHSDLHGAAGMMCPVLNINGS